MRTILLSTLFVSAFAQGIHAQSSVNEAPTVRLVLQGDIPTISAGLYNLSQTRYGSERIDWQILKRGEFTIDVDPVLDELISQGFNPMICYGCDAWEIPIAPLLKIGETGVVELAGIEFCPDCAEVEPLPECSKQLSELGYSAYLLQATPRYIAQFLAEGPVEFDDEKIIVVGRFADNELVGWYKADIAEHAETLVVNFCPECGQVDPLPEGCEEDDD